MGKARRKRHVIQVHTEPEPESSSVAEESAGVFNGELVKMIAPYLEDFDILTLSTTCPNLLMMCRFNVEEVSTNIPKKFRNYPNLRVIRGGKQDGCFHRDPRDCNVEELPDKVVEIHQELSIKKFSPDARVLNVGVPLRDLFPKDGKSESMFSMLHTLIIHEIAPMPKSLMNQLTSLTLTIQFISREDVSNFFNTICEFENLTSLVVEFRDGQFLNSMSDHHTLLDKIPKSLTKFHFTCWRFGVSLTANLHENLKDLKLHVHGIGLRCKLHELKHLEKLDLHSCGEVVALKLGHNLKVFKCSWSGYIDYIGPNLEVFDCSGIKIGVIISNIKKLSCNGIGRIPRYITELSCDADYELSLQNAVFENEHLYLLTLTELTVPGYVIGWTFGRFTNLKKLTMSSCVDYYPRSLTDLTITQKHFTGGHIPATVVKLKIEAMSRDGYIDSVRCITPDMLPAGLTHFICNTYCYNAYHKTHNQWIPNKNLKFVEIQRVIRAQTHVINYEKMFEHCEFVAFGSYIKKRTLDGPKWMNTEENLRYIS